MTPLLCHPERSLAENVAIRETQSKDLYKLEAASNIGVFLPRVAGVLSLVALLLTSTRSQVSRTFPGTNREITSPDGRYAIENVDHRDEHVLSLKNNSTGRLRQIYKYTRGASVVWSPDSLHFAVDDAAGSDYTETRVFSVDDGVPEIDVQKEIIGKAEKVPSGHHEYFYIAYWVDASRLVVYHWGYGGEDPDGFCDCYVYRLNGSVHKCARQPKASDRACQQAIP